MEQRLLFGSRILHRVRELWRGASKTARLVATIAAMSLTASAIVHMPIPIAQEFEMSARAARPDPRPIAEQEHPTLTLPSAGVNTPDIESALAATPIDDYVGGSLSSAQSDYAISITTRRANSSDTSIPASYSPIASSSGPAFAPGNPTEPGETIPPSPAAPTPSGTPIPDPTPPSQGASPAPTHASTAAPIVPVSPGETASPIVETPAPSAESGQPVGEAPAPSAEPVPPAIEPTGERTTGEPEWTTVEIARDPRAGVTFTRSSGLSYSIGVPNANLSGPGVLLADGSVSYPSVGSSANAVVPNKDGVQLLTVIRDEHAPTRYRYQVTVPEGAHIELFQQGARVMSAEGTVISAVGAAWARDANGQMIPSHFELEGNDLIQVVEHTTTDDVAYPVVADPLWWDIFAVIISLVVQAFLVIFTGSWLLASVVGDCVKYGLLDLYDDGEFNAGAALRGCYSSLLYDGVGVIIPGVFGDLVGGCVSAALLALDAPYNPGEACAYGMLDGARRFAVSELVGKGGNKLLATYFSKSTRKSLVLIGQAFLGYGTSVGTTKWLPGPDSDALRGMVLAVKELTENGLKRNADRALEVMKSTSPKRAWNHAESGAFVQTGTGIPQQLCYWAEWKWKGRVVYRYARTCISDIYTYKRISTRTPWWLTQTTPSGESFDPVLALDYLWTSVWTDEEKRLRKADLKKMAVDLNTGARDFEGQLQVNSSAGRLIRWLKSNTLWDELVGTEVPPAVGGLDPNWNTAYRNWVDACGPWSGDVADRDRVPEFVFNDRYYRTWDRWVEPTPATWANQIPPAYPYVAPNGMEGAPLD